MNRYVLVQTQTALGVAADFDSAPAMVVYANGAVAVSTASIANKATGLYCITVDVAAEEVAADLAVVLTGLIATVAARGTVNIRNGFEAADRVKLEAVHTVKPDNKPTVNAGGASLVSNPGSAAGDGDIEVDHDTGGADNLRLMQGGVAVDNAIVEALLSGTVRGTAYTDVNGRWANPMMLDAGTYTFRFRKDLMTVTATQEVA
jgi:hypothetical protein